MYEISKLESVIAGKCCICGKHTNFYIDIAEWEGITPINVSIQMPVCNGEHYDQLAAQSKMIIGHAEAINKSIKSVCENNAKERNHE